MSNRCVLSVAQWYSDWESGEVVNRSKYILMPVFIDREWTNNIETDSVKRGLSC